MDQYQTRADIPEKYKWDLQSVYSSIEAWEADFGKIDAAIERVEAFRGQLAKGPKILLDAFSAQTDLDLLIDQIYTFAHHQSDEDTRDSENLGRVDRIRGKATEAMARLSWFDPELGETSDSELKMLQSDPILKDYDRRLELLIRSKKHQRSAEVEEILSLASEPLSNSYKAFSLLENADMKFPSVKDQHGKEIEVNHSTFSTCLESSDRILRKNSFTAYLGKFGDYQNTFAATLDGHVKKQVFYAKVRKFDSAIEASLFSDMIPLSVYNGLIATTHQHLPLLHRLFRIRKKVLGLNDYSLWDNLVPMVKPATTDVSYDQACEWVIEAAKPMGEEYGKALKTAIQDRWIDVYYTAGKRSGAYSGGMFKTKPFILLNHKNNLGSAFTLAHELGHSLHTHFSNQNQVYAKAGYPIFLAEVASTTLEMLMHFFLVDQAKTGKWKSREMQLYLLDHLFTQFRATLYRQVQFAEFERDIHAMVEQGEPLTAKSLGQAYGVLNQRYYGSEVAHHDAIQNEWSRIPHFYYNFYVYKYATSFAAAQYFSKKIYEGDTHVRDSFLKFLKSGGSKDPLDTLIQAGVDLRDSKPIESAFQVFGQSLDEFEHL